MKLLHTADLHLGQILYQYYTRTDEHRHFFDQLTDWCLLHRPDLLLVCGDIFDVSQPGAQVKAFFNSTFVALRQKLPEMHIVVTAGNHDSPSRIQADNSLWQMGGVTVIGQPPSPELLRQPDGWQKDYIVETPAGYVAALPFCSAWNTDLAQSLLDYVAQRNSAGLPVVMMAHQTVAGCDFLGHLDSSESISPVEVGGVRSLLPETLGHGYDYLALGHIHRPQTIGRPVDEEFDEESRYDGPVIRYSGSPLHVSCDEAYPHTVSLVDIARHGGGTTLRRLRVDQRRHFFDIPSRPAPAAKSFEEVMTAVDECYRQHGGGYIRLRVDHGASLPVDFINRLYNHLDETTHNELRLNPKTIWENKPTATDDTSRPTFLIAELQQMTDPLQFVKQTIDRYDGLDVDKLDSFFSEIEAELRLMDEERNNKTKHAPRS